jgi:hypothetical protein
VSAQPRDPRLFELFSAAVQKALEYVRLAETGKTHIGSHDNWPEISWHENGLPYVTKKISDNPKNYSDAISGIYSSLYGILGVADEPILEFSKEPEFLNLANYMNQHTRLQALLLLKGELSDIGTTRLQGIVGGLLDRYIHINNTLDLERGKLLAIYLPIEKYLFEDRLPIVIVVPILFLKFEVPKFHIEEHIWVEELSDDQHLARGWHGPWGNSENDLVESAATHALFISGRFIENHNYNWLILGQAIMEPESYPVETIDTFFAALRIATGYPTGYAQLLTHPIGWASGYTANLLSLEGPTVKKYPPSFEHGAWRDEVPTISTDQADTIRDAFQNLWHVFGMNQGRKIQLAIHRLNLSALRTTDEDGVIDAMIAMEALLSDGAQEMTHKIAMRLAALYKIVDPARSEQAFKEMKRIYTFRSKIVHGGADLEKFRELDRDGVRVPAVDAAVEHLRIAFNVLIKNPALLDPIRIDSFLLTGQL